MLRLSSVQAQIQKFQNVVSSSALLFNDLFNVELYRQSRLFYSSLTFILILKVNLGSSAVSSNMSEQSKKQKLVSRFIAVFIGNNLTAVSDNDRHRTDVV